MKNYSNTISCRLHIGFHEGNSAVLCKFEGFNGVFGRTAFGGSAMSKNLENGRGEVWLHQPASLTRLVFRYVQQIY